MAEAAILLIVIWILMGLLAVTYGPFALCRWATFNVARYRSRVIAKAFSVLE